MSSPQTATIAVVGDFMLDHRPDPADIAATRALFQDADLVIANVDAVLSEQGTPVPKWVNLRAPRAVAHDLRAMGIDVVTLANNHVMDFRAAGMLDTRRAYDEAGIRHVGAGENLAAATAPLLVETNGVRVAVLSLACTLAEEAAAGPNWPGIAPVHVHHAFVVEQSLLAEQPGTVPTVRTWLDERDAERARQDVATTRAAADVVLAIPHWGVPSPWRAPSHPVVQEYQRALGRLLIDAGADAVLGNHPHELHGIEFHAGRPIAYSLGNFWIDGIASWPWMGFESIVLRLTVSRAGVASLEVVSLFLDGRGVPQPDPTNRAVDLLTAHSADLGATIARVGARFLVTESS